MATETTVANVAYPTISAACKAHNVDRAAVYLHLREIGGTPEEVVLHYAGLATQTEASTSA